MSSKPFDLLLEHLAKLRSSELEGLEKLLQDIDDIQNCIDTLTPQEAKLLLNIIEQIMDEVHHRLPEIEQKVASTALGAKAVDAYKKY